MKVKFSLCLSKHDAMKEYWGVEVCLHEFLTSALNGCERSASRPSRLTPVLRATVNHAMGSRMDFRAGPDTVKRKKIPLLPFRELNPGLPARRLVCILTELPRLSVTFSARIYSITWI
jgi:hypothetical protein